MAYADPRLCEPQGYIILCGIVDLSSHNLVSGAVRVCFSLIYSLFLGFGLAIGATAYSRLSGHALRGQDDLMCSSTHHPGGPWWQRTPSVKWGECSCHSSFMASVCGGLHNDRRTVEQGMCGCDVAQALYPDRRGYV